MKIINRIKTWWLDRQRRKIIENMVDYEQISDTKKKILMKGMFKSSKIVANEIVENTKQISAYKDEQLYSDLKKVIQKHFDEVIDKCVKENEDLKKQLKLKENELNKVKKNITETLLN